MIFQMHRRALAALALASVLPAVSFAQTGDSSNWPARPITLVVPFPPGGATDVIGRQLAELLRKDLGQTVIVENKAGAATAIGAAAVARAPKDGYTLLLSTGTTFAVVPHLTDKLPYKLDDFDPVGAVCTGPFAFVVKKDFPARNIGEFVAYAKAHPGHVNNATNGQGSLVHLLGELVASGLGIQMTQVHYKGAAPATMDMIAGVVDSNVETLTSATPNVKAGKYRALAVLSAERQPSMPDVPTFKELGYPSVVGETLYAVFAPAGTPKPVVDKLNAALRKITTSSGFEQAMHNIGNEPKSSTPEELRENMLQQDQQWGGLIRRLNIKAE